MLTEDQSGVGRNTRLRHLAVCHGGGDGEETLATRLHANDSDVPALDDFAFAETELELFYTSDLV